MRAPASRPEEHERIFVGAVRDLGGARQGTRRDLSKYLGWACRCLGGLSEAHGGSPVTAGGEPGRDRQHVRPSRLPGASPSRLRPGVTVATTFEVGRRRPGLHTAFTQPGSPANRALVVRVGSWLAWAAAAVEVAIAIAARRCSTNTRLGILSPSRPPTRSRQAIGRDFASDHGSGSPASTSWGAVGAVMISGAVYFSQSFIDLVPLVYGWAPMVAFALWGRRRAIAHRRVHRRPASRYGARDPLLQPLPGPGQTYGSRSWS